MHFLRDNVHYAYFSPPWGLMGNAYCSVHLRLIGKCAVDFVLVNFFRSVLLIGC